MTTLKDIEEEFKELGEDGNFLNCLYRCREAARERIKELQKEIEDTKDKFVDETEAFLLEAKIDCLRRFCNLEEE